MKQVTRRFGFGLLAMIVATVTALAATPTLQAASDDSSFAAAVDLEPFGRMAVFTDGRLKSFASHASAMMQFVSGSRRIDGHAPGFTYLDLLFRPAAYADVAIIFVKKKPIRAELVQAMRNSAMFMRSSDAEAELERFLDTGLIRASWLTDPTVAELRARLSRDLMRYAKPMGEIDTALAVNDPRVLGQALRLLPPADESVQSPWRAIADASRPEIAGSYGPKAALVQEVGRQWEALRAAWAAQDAAGVNAAAAILVDRLPELAPAIYPDQSRLGWESWYFRSANMTWVWIVYVFSAIFFVMATAYRWRWAWLVGLGIFLAAFGLHTFALGLRWYVSGRWPNSNMFEAVTTAAWFGGCLALVLEVGLRRTPMRSMFGLGSAVASMTALMAAYYLPLQLNPNIGNMMPVLHDVWLYIHTNVIIFSYCLIFMAAVVAAAYLVYRIFGGDREYARVGGAGSFMSIRPDGSTYLEANRSSLGVVLDGATMVLMELSFIMLWTGLVMGAIWADHSWGRPWGWDPKEVFALNTFLVFAILVHVRMKVKDKGLWTALLALFGAVVMLFNWIFINFYISGLHSYA
ncbi:MAG: cytochrome c biogenesis protein CcsA [Phycisphaerales bacterium]|nr:cytochrome c biogenesis protein CcsA [Phycisphaerales bacterium]